MRKPIVLFCFVAIAVATHVSTSRAATLSFLADPALLDNNPADGVISGTEFSPTGSDGTIFVFTPTNNLVGGDRFLLSPANGLSFGGGSGSSLSFDFTPNNNIQLNSYAIGGGISLNNPVFDIRQGVNVLSMGNAGDTSGAFASAPVLLTGGTTYSFVVTNSGAGIQRQMSSWDYTTTAVPEPTTYGLFSVAGIACVVYRRRKNIQNRS